MNFEEIKQDYLKEADLRLREMALNIEKAELEALKQKKQIDENMASMKNAKDTFAGELEQLKNVAEDEWDAKVEAFDKKFKKDDIMDEVTEKAKEYTEKTRKFLAGFGNKVSDLYHKSVDEMKKSSGSDKDETTGTVEKDKE